MTIVRARSRPMSRPVSTAAVRTRYPTSTAVPVAMIAVTFVANSSRAPTDWSGAPDSSVSPTTAKGGTSEIAIATPGRVSETSERTRAKAPTAPVASAETRSISFGSTRPATCELVSATIGPGMSRPSR